MNNSLEKKDDKLLRQERYLRRSISAYLYFAIFLIVGAISAFFRKPDEAGISYTPYLGFLVLACLLIAYATHTKLCHIASIKYYRGLIQKSFGPKKIDES